MDTKNIAIKKKTKSRRKASAFIEIIVQVFGGSCKLKKICHQEMKKF